MKKIFTLFLLFFGLIAFSFAQNSSIDLIANSEGFLYVNAFVDSKAEVNALSHNFSVDNCHFDERSGKYTVRIYLSHEEYADFAAQNVPFEILTPERPPGNNMVATTLSDFTADWNKYPAYDVYVELMHTFETNFPNICKIDTILAATPNPQRPHMLLAAHLSNTLGQPSDKPAFFYSSTMHGDEVVGYYMMLRLIDYILNNATTDEQIQNILNNVDLYICPLENPDGTYKSSNTQISSTSSQRYNYNNVDLNRNYPFVPGISGSANVQPETRAMIDWVTDKHFVMSVNFHGGAELTNFPWDSWESNDRQHPDDSWFRYVCQNYVNTCHESDANYMVGETAYQPGCGAVTEGGDWYVIDGSRQDYMNYYQHCREITIEAHFDKVVTSSTELPTYWTNSKNSLLDYIQECLYGFRGVVTDAVTGEPIEAKVFVRNHDTFNSEVYSHLPIGNYHRPIKAGTYTVEVSADCYQTETFTITTTDGAGVRHDVQLQPLVSAPQVADQTILSGETATLTATSSHTINWYDAETTTTPLASGLSFTTPVLTATTVYYVEEAENVNGATCVSDRTPVTVFVEEDTADVDPEPQIAYADASYSNCESFEYEGVVYTQSGDYEIVYEGAAASTADSILRLHITIFPAYDVTLPLTVTEGDTYDIEGITYTALLAGMYTYDRYHLTVHGCDSTIHYVVYVTSPDIAYGDLIIDGCPPFEFNGEILTMNGDYTFYYPGQAVGGIDSILVVHLTLHQPYNETINVELEIGDSYMMGNDEFVAMVEGVFDYDYTYSTIYGCDSIIHYHITVGSVGLNELSDANCDVYPNPANTSCWIARKHNGTALITLYDAAGRKMQEFETTENKTLMDLTSLNAGFYFIHIRENDMEVVKKIVKQ